MAVVPPCLNVFFRRSQTSLELLFSGTSDFESRDNAVETRRRLSWEYRVEIEAGHSQQQRTRRGVHAAMDYRDPKVCSWDESGSLQDTVETRRRVSTAGSLRFRSTRSYFYFLWFASGGQHHLRNYIKFHEHQQQRNHTKKTFRATARAHCSWFFVRLFRSKKSAKNREPCARTILQQIRGNTANFQNVIVRGNYKIWYFRNFVWGLLGLVEASWRHNGLKNDGLNRFISQYESIEASFLKSS